MTQSSETFISKGFNKLAWCKNQVHGIKLVEPNDSLAKQYLNAAEETLKLVKYDKLINSNLWLATHNYYLLYFCAYSILMKLGIKSEIHECTIALIKELENRRIVNLKISNKLEASKLQRIDNQYYLKNETVNVNEEELNIILISTSRFINKTDMKKIIFERKLITKNKT